MNENEETVCPCCQEVVKINKLIRNSKGEYVCGICYEKESLFDDLEKLKTFCIKLENEDLADFSYSVYKFVSEVESKYGNKLPKEHEEMDEICL